MVRNVFLVLLMSLVAMPVFAQGKSLGVGYDTGLNMVMVRKAMGDNNLDLGFGMDYNGALPAEKFSLGVAGFYLIPLTTVVSSWVNDEKLRLHFFTGGIFNLKNNHTKDNKLAVACGLQPEYFIHDKVSFETRLGLNVGIIEDFALQSFGNGMNIVSSLAFKIYLD